MFAFVLWGFSITPLLAFTAAYIKSRLHQRRESGELPTSMLDLLLPLAPTSQATLAIMSLGVQSRRVWADTVGPATAPLLLGEMAMAVGAILGLMLWASAAAWFISAHVLIVVSWAKQMQRNDGNCLSRLWQPTVSKLAMCHAVYPVGSFAMATAYLAYVWDSPTALYTAEVLVIWVALLLVVALVKSFVDSVHFAAALLRRPKQPPLPTHSRNTSTITTTVITVYGSI
ncbi:hypothetical protein FBU59_003146 [Linderina macrospora]|uniref:Uncharacterized protein n=1 Tax=Linderina macrospora TaxID=4868 RepID=A0ACC1J9A8_9FUNG|nr:hypothetical protein FBU59_003146 [Linderina macrospora]